MPVYERWSAVANHTSHVLTNDVLECDNVACKDIKDSASGSNLVIQRYLAYNAFINLSNWFEVMISQLLDAANNGLGISTTLATVSENVAYEGYFLTVDRLSSRTLRLRLRGAKSWGP